MAQLTDPARELAELCERLASGTHRRGDEFLAECLGVESWSREFYQIIFTIVARCDQLIEIIDTLDLDQDHKADAVTHVTNITYAFDATALTTPWVSRGHAQVSATNVQPVKMLSYAVRQKVSFPRLSDEELAELLRMVNELSSWLEDHQLSEHDFIRQAIIDGVDQFRFRLERLGWLGWGYTMESLREVIGAYYTLYGASGGAADNPDAEAVLAKVRSFMQGVYEKTKTAKDVTEAGDFLLRMYGTAMLGINHIPGVAGLLAG